MKKSTSSFIVPGKITSNIKKQKQFTSFYTATTKKLTSDHITERRLTSSITITVYHFPHNSLTTRKSFQILQKQKSLPSFLPQTEKSPLTSQQQESSSPISHQQTNLTLPP
jgi:hypothetical protein